MSKENVLIISFVGIVSLLVIVGGAVLVSKTKPRELDTGGSARAEILDEKIHDWGQIDIEGGNVEKVFRIRNNGDSDLEVTNVKTSCMCTEAQLSISGQNSPVFGMHTISGWVGSIKPGETAEVRVVFDPLFHGPQGTGPITRLVSLNTNDVNNRTVELRLMGNVVRTEN